MSDRKWVVLAAALGACGGTEVDVRQSAAACAGSPGPAALTHALCVCGDLRDVGSLTVNLATPGWGGVGVNGRADVEHSVVVRGSWATGGAMAFRGSAVIEGDLSVGGDLVGSGDVRVGGALRVAGQMSAPVQAASTQPFVTGAPPCECGLDVAGLVSQARASNDNAAHGLPPKLAAAGPVVTLPTGRYYFDDPAALGATKLVVTGGAAVFLDGDLDAIPTGAVELAPGATLDLYVRGNVRHVGAARIGQPAAPTAFRLYVGGDQMVAVGAQIFDGAIYAPRAVVTYIGSTIVRGGLVAHALDGRGSIQIEGAQPSAPRPEVCDLDTPPIQ
jgi:hypothetical protein